MKKRLILLIWGVAILPFVFILLMIFFIELDVFGKMPTFEDLENPKSALATEIYAEDGAGYALLGRFAMKNRSHIEYKELFKQQHLIQALIATEDIRFTKHSGIDFRSMGRVFVKTFIGGSNKSGGGSTITQQLALNLFRDGERSSNRTTRIIQKLQEWVTAVKLERNYTKEEIITMYFNTIPFGYNSYGIRTAAQIYFNKLPSELNVEESALMVGLLNAPSLYNPKRNPELSKQRRDLVLGQMQKYGYLTRREHDSLIKLPVKLNFRRVDHNSGSGTYFREMLRQTMKMQKPDLKNYRFRTIEDYRADSLQWEKNPLFGWCNKNLVNGQPYNIDKDGLKIYTTINAKMQQYAEEAVELHLSKELQPKFDETKKYRKNFPFAVAVTDREVNESIMRAIKNSDRYREMKKAGASEADILKSFDTPVKMTIFSWKSPNHEIDTVMSPRDSILYFKSILRIAFMAMEPHTGKVKAYIGGPDFRFFKFDNVRQGRRQVGSTIKPFLYTLAIMDGMKPCDKIINEQQMVQKAEGGTWNPATTEKKEYIGKAITLKLALCLSSNNVSAFLIQKYPPAALIALCRRFGLTSFMDPVPAICLGTSDMSTYEMVAAYNTFPSKGIYIYPHFVSHIEDKYGNRLDTFVPEKTEAINERDAYTTVRLMQGVVLSGTGARVRNYLTTTEVAGKTGTTEKNSDGWFIAYVPKLTAGVWVGNEDNQSYLLGDGARMALPVWGHFMKKVTADSKLSVNASDKFEVPLGMDLSEFNCKDDAETSDYDD
ncbi:MAG: transglycosylase domain-containing protein [Prevotellaceae bacterium]|nr:transglycosylase domain-containing protein [Prevotellaceae bacterium]